MPKIAVNDRFIKELIHSEDYLVEKDGRVLSRRNAQGHLVDTYREIICTYPNGYKYINYFRKRLMVHRIVYAKYVGHLNELMEINHKDGDPGNNHYLNLELTNTSENLLHKYQVLGHLPVVGHSKITQEIADSIRRDRASGRKFSELMAKYKVSKSTISYVVNGKIWNN